MHELISCYRLSTTCDNIVVVLKEMKHAIFTYKNSHEPNFLGFAITSHILTHLIRRVNGLFRVIVCIISVLYVMAFTIPVLCVVESKRTFLFLLRYTDISPLFFSQSTIHNEFVWSCQNNFKIR